MHRSNKKSVQHKARIRSLNLKRGLTVSSLVRDYFQAYNSARLNEACRLLSEKMLDQRRDVTVGLTIAGALTPAGLSGSVVSMMKNGFIDFIISTGANMYHDMHYALDYQLIKGDFQADDRELFKKDIVRIYDIFLKEKMLLGTDQYFRNFIEKDKCPKKLMSSSELHYHIGRYLLKRSPNPDCSILAQAARYNVPVYTSSPGDSSLGMELARFSLDQPGLIIDPNLDVLETTAIVAYAKENGAILVGGGSPKNFYMQTQPMLWQFLNMGRGGHDYFIQMTMDSPQWGGLSGATPGEAVSWGKINPDELKNTVVVYADFTIALPILFSYAFEQAKPRKRKNLFLHRAALMKRMEKEYHKKKTKSYL